MFKASAPVKLHVFSSTFNVLKDIFKRLISSIIESNRLEKYDVFVFYSNK